MMACVHSKTLSSKIHGLIEDICISSCVEKASREETILHTHTLCKRPTGSLRTHHCYGTFSLTHEDTPNEDTTERGRHVKHSQIQPLIALMRELFSDEKSCEWPDVLRGTSIQTIVLEGAEYTAVWEKSV